MVAELMLMGFLSLLLTVGQGIITDICVPKSLSNSWHPCKEKSKGVVEKSQTFDSKVLVSKCKSKA